MNTTAGSYSLLGSVVPDDAGVVKRLRTAGAIILGALIPILIFMLKNLICHRESKSFRVLACQRESDIWMVRTRRSMHRRVLSKC